MAGLNKKTKYKLLALDLDGVLRNSRGQVPPRSIFLIKKIQRFGVRVIVVTGKSLVTARRFALAIGVKDLIICHHGAVIGDPVKNKIIFEKPLPRYSLDIIGPMLKKYPELQGYFSLNNRFYLVENPAFPKGQRLHEKKSLQLEKIFQLGEDLKKKLKVAPSKIFFYTPKDKEGKYKKIFKKKFGGKINVFRSVKRYVELSPISVSKGKALKKMLKKFKIKPSEAIAIGDEENDISIIRLAGLGVAIKNAVPAVKKVADYVTARTNDQGGVDEVIEKFVLI